MKYSFGTRTSNSPPARSRLSRGETGHTRERTRAARDVHDHHSWLLPVKANRSHSSFICFLGLALQEHRLLLRRKESNIRFLSATHGGDPTTPAYFLPAYVYHLELEGQRPRVPLYSVFVFFRPATRRRPPSLSRLRERRSARGTSNPLTASVDGSILAQS